MNRLVNGNNNFYYASVIGGQGLTSDNVIDIGTGHSLSYDINYLENNIGGGSLNGDVIIGTNFSNTISVNSGQTTYNNNEIIKVKDNSMASIRLQCDDAGPTDLMILNTTNGNESMYLPLKYTEIGNVASGGVQIGDGTNAGATNLYGIVSLKNATDSTAYTSTTCSNVAGGLSVYKKLNVGGNIVSSGSISGVSLSATGTTASTTYLTGVIICSGGMGIAGAINSNSTINVASSVSCYGFTNGGVNTLGNTTDSSGLLTGAIQCSGGVSISKKIYTGSGIMLPTTGGTASLLSYYEEYTMSVAFGPSGGGSYLFNGNTYITRIGKIVTWRIPVFTGTSNALGGYITATVAPVLTRFCPPATVNFLLPISISNGTTGVIQSAPGMLQILSTGVVNIFSSPAGAGTFTSGNGSQPVGDVVVTWSIN